MSQLQLISIGSTILAGILLWIIEALAPYYFNRKAHARHAIKNFSIAGVNILIMLPFSLFTAFVLLEAKPYWMGLRALNLEPWQHTLLIVISIDLWMYIWHRINHRVDFLWRFHAVHHSDPEMDVSTAWRFHWVEITLSELIRLPVFVLLGAQVQDLLIYNTIMTPIIAFHHSNISLPDTFDRVLRWVIPTPHLHRLHHSMLRSEHDNNYGSMLSVWDRSFGTLLQQNQSLKSLQLGLKDEISQEDQTFGALMRRPFKSVTAS
jgi:sterol desaturase/sphingolipid hydroxylase (fatty acid hydroxylase superfamily)